ncbi:hypothetical protein EC973_001242 [Apophysomyces ossiformis]|uniref:Uncharacterized protein n=1 Tax=Apophysomyces ossiformis TaxID=679940 RepID=A0A8H7EMH5_9FUNG|nr:hypothetical protein EC973_001242 [Apophysomyces ossiformis]
MRLFHSKTPTDSSTTIAATPKEVPTTPSKRTHCPSMSSNDTAVAADQKKSRKMPRLLPCRQPSDGQLTKLPTQPEAMATTAAAQSIDMMMELDLDHWQDSLLRALDRAAEIKPSANVSASATIPSSQPQSYQRHLSRIPRSKRRNEWKKEKEEDDDDKTLSNPIVFTKEKTAKPRKESSLLSAQLKREEGTMSTKAKLEAAAARRKLIKDNHMRERADAAWLETMRMKTGQGWTIRDIPQSEDQDKESNSDRDVLIW